MISRSEAKFTCKVDKISNKKKSTQSQSKQK